MSVHLVEDLAEHPAVTVRVLIGDGRFGRSTADAEVVQIAVRRIQSIGDVADRIATRKLTEHHAYKLAPCVVALAMLVSFCLADDLTDVFFRQLADCLSEKCYICHRK